MRTDEERIYYSPNVVNLCIDNYDMEKQCGRLYHQYTEEPFRFSSLFEALKRMDELYDDLGLPEATTRTRSFLEKSGGEKREYLWGKAEDSTDIQEKKRIEVRKTVPFDSVTGQRGKGATFIIRVQYRQHSSWQGEVTWVDGRKRDWFGSVLELVEWVDTAIRHAGKSIQC